MQQAYLGIGCEVGTTDTNLGQFAICSCTLEQAAMWDLIFTRVTCKQTNQLTWRPGRAEGSQQPAEMRSAHLFATAPAGGFERGQLLLHTGGALHLLGVKGHSTQGAERRGHLETWL